MCVLFLILDAHSKDWLAPPPSCKWYQGSWQDTALTRCTPWRSPWQWQWQRQWQWQDTALTRCTPWRSPSPPPWAAPWSSSAAPSPCMCTSSLRVWFWKFSKNLPRIFFIEWCLLIRNITSDLSSRCLRGKTGNGHWWGSMSHGTLLSCRKFDRNESDKNDYEWQKWWWQPYKHWEVSSAPGGQT